MSARLDPLSFLVVSFAGWLNQHQQQVIPYLMEENRALREQIGNRRVRFNDDQRRRLAAKAKKIARKILGEVVLHLLDSRLIRNSPCTRLAGNEHARSFLPESAYTPIGFRVLRRVDGTGLFLVPSTPGGEFERGTYRIIMTYRRNNQAVDPDSPIFSEGGDSGSEVVALDIPWSTDT